MEISKKSCLNVELLNEILSSASEIGTNTLIPILQQIQKVYGYLPQDTGFSFAKPDEEALAQSLP